MGLELLVRVNLDSYLLVGKHTMLVDDHRVFNPEKCEKCGAPVVVFDLLYSSPHICLKCARLAAVEKMSFRLD